MTSLPDFYPSPLHLPFNQESLNGKLRLSTPDKASDDDDSFWVLLRGNELLVRWSDDAPFLPEGQLPGFLASGGLSPVYMGTWKGKPCWAMPISRKIEIPTEFTAENILANRPRLPISLLSLAGVASQILHWERTGRYCSLCGGMMERLAGEWGKKCLDCGYLHFPHIHPCVIVLVRRGKEVLLTRKGNWAPNRYSLVAGFLDFGECLEEAVEREVFEETGVRIKNIRYIGSQCWPFPSQLMAGYVADYAGGEVVVEEEELEDARWFSVDALPDLPPKRSIARYLLDTYACQEAFGLVGP